MAPNPVNGYVDPMRNLIPLLFGALALGLPAHAGKKAGVAPHSLYADDGAVVTLSGPTSFAVVGQTTGFETTDAVLADLLRAAADPAGPRFVVLMGDTVASGTEKAYKRMDQSWGPLLVRPPPPPRAEDDRSVEKAPPPSGPLAALPVAGVGEGSGDPEYTMWNKVFPGVGADIGLNRVASWYAVDLVSGDTTWRLVVLDSNKARLGARWAEQSRWLTEVSKGDYDGLLVFFSEAPYNLLGAKPTPARAAAAGELLDTLDDHIDERKLKAVFNGGAPGTQVLLPEGAWGPLYLTAGGGGAPCATLFREASAEGEDPLTLEPTFDTAMIESVRRYSETNTLPDAVLDEALARGEFAGLPGRIPGDTVPTWGWFQVTLDGPALGVDLRLATPDAGFVSAWRATTTLGAPWKPSN